MSRNRKLSEVLEEFDPCRDLTIVNFDKKPVGTHHVGVYIEALRILDLDFMASTVDDSDDTISIIIEELNSDILTNFIYEANVKEMEHDKYYGDGKYWKENS